jgi:hypothetical protein
MSSSLRGTLKELDALFWFPKLGSKMALARTALKWENRRADFGLGWQYGNID